MLHAGPDVQLVLARWPADASPLWRLNKRLQLLLLSQNKREANSAYVAAQLSLVLVVQLTLALGADVQLALALGAGVAVL